MSLYFLAWTLHGGKMLICQGICAFPLSCFSLFMSASIYFERPFAICCSGPNKHTRTSNIEGKEKEMENGAAYGNEVVFE